MNTKLNSRIIMNWPVNSNFSFLACSLRMDLSPLNIVPLPISLVKTSTGEGTGYTAWEGGFRGPSSGVLAASERGFFSSLYQPRQELLLRTL